MLTDTISPASTALRMPCTVSLKPLTPTSWLWMLPSALYSVTCTLSRLAAYSPAHSSGVSRRPLVFSRVTNHSAARTSSTRSSRSVGSPPVKVTWGMLLLRSVCRMVFHCSVDNSSVCPIGCPAA